MDEEFAVVPDGLRSLRQHYEDATIAEMVSKEPLLLIEDLENVLRELERQVDHAECCSMRCRVHV